MGLFARLADYIKGENRAASAALARAAGQPARVPLESSVERMADRLRILRDEQRHGVLAPWVPVNLDWRFEHIDTTWQAAEIGNMIEVAKMIEAMRHIGIVAGLMSTLTSMVRLPVKFAGDPFLCSQLRGEVPNYDAAGRRITAGRRGVFSRMFPKGALINLIYTGRLAGVAVGEFVDDPQTGLPVLHTRDLHRVRFDWGQRVWCYRGQNDEYVIKPGDGRWLLWFPEDDWRPWRSGRWLPLSLAFVVAITSVYDRARYGARNADPLKWIKVGEKAPPEEVDRLENFVKYWWERAPGLILPYGSEAGLAEVQGRGHEIFRDNMSWAEAQIKFALAGQTVTSDGRGGLTDGGDLFRDIAESIIEGVAESLAECLTDQGLAPWSYRFWGVPRDESPSVAWDARSPQRRLAEADAAIKISQAIQAADQVYVVRGRRVNADAYYDQHGLAIPTEPIPSRAPAPDGASALRASPEPPPMLPPGPSDGEEQDGTVS